MDPNPDPGGPNKCGSGGSGSGAFLTPGSGIRDDQPGSYFRELINHFFGVKIIKFFDAYPGWEKFGSGINIPDPQHCIIDIKQTADPDPELEGQKRELFVKSLSRCIVIFNVRVCGQ